MTPQELIADHKRLTKNIARLGQVAATARRRFEVHNATCPYVNPLDTEISPDDCSECFRLLVVSRAYLHAHQTVTGKMVWR